MSVFVGHVAILIGKRPQRWGNEFGAGDAGDEVARRSQAALPHQVV